jgi:hypothetical protein
MRILKTIAEWLVQYPAVGAEQGYTPTEIEEYGAYIRLFALRYQPELLKPKREGGEMTKPYNSLDDDNAFFVAREAREKLNAAAPDLLAALEEALPYVERAYECAFPDEAENERICDTARAAIARAKGEK